MSQHEVISLNPSTGAEIWRGAAASLADVDAAVARARAAFPAWARRPLAERIGLVEAYRDVVRSKANAFADLIADETGKPRWETATEVASVAAKVDISVQAYHERTGEKAADGPAGRAVLRHKAHGVLAVLGPYNFPAHLPNGHIVPALIAGNTVVLKPSELTPATAEFMARCWADAGLPDGVLNVVQGAQDTGRALSGNDGIDGLLFTGSATTGLALHRQFADTPNRILALEMGGNNPLICWDAEDIDAAAATIVQSAYVTSGQRCTCARRLILPTGVFGDAILRAVALLADRIIIGAPFDDPQPYIGPVVSNQAADRLAAGFQKLRAAGADVLRPLERLREGLPFVSPGLVDVTGLRLPDEEHFGPLLQVIRVADFDAAMREANATRFGLAAGLLSSDQALYERFWTGSRAGIVNWNRPTTGAASSAPFGGIGISGNHRPSAYYAADYCAFPVAGIEAEAPAAQLPAGFRP